MTQRRTRTKPGYNSLKYRGSMQNQEPESTTDANESLNMVVTGHKISQPPTQRARMTNNRQRTQSCQSDDNRQEAESRTGKNQDPGQPSLTAHFTLERMDDDLVCTCEMSDREINTTHNLRRIDEEDNSLVQNDLNESSNYANSFTQVGLTSKIAKSPLQSASKCGMHDSSLEVVPRDNCLQIVDN